MKNANWKTAYNFATTRVSDNKKLGVCNSFTEKGIHIISQDEREACACMWYRDKRSDAQVISILSRCHLPFSKPNTTRRWAKKPLLALNFKIPHTHTHTHKNSSLSQFSQKNQTTNIKKVENLSSAPRDDYTRSSPKHWSRCNIRCATRVSKCNFFLKATDESRDWRKVAKGRKVKYFSYPEREK
jgi:hypothetical protein